MTIKDVNNIPKLLNDLDAILDRVARRVGAYMEAKIVEMIDRQWGGWPPLDPKTVRKKKSSKAWVDTGELRSLITHVIEGRIPKTVKVGIFEHEKGLIAHFLEFGTKNIPERPLFRLVFDLEKEKVLQMIKERAEQRIGAIFDLALKMREVEEKSWTLMQENYLVELTREHMKFLGVSTRSMEKYLIMKRESTNSNNGGPIFWEQQRLQQQ